MADPVFKKSEVSQTFDLKEMFGEDVEITAELKEAVGGAILEKIRDRTANGAGFGGSPIAHGKYSDAYSESIPFLAAGKDQHEVNMELTGDMLGLMDIVKQTGSSIKIGWEDELQNAKAFNHNTGDTVPKRNFFGLSKSEIREVAKEFKPAVEKKQRGDEPRDAYTEKALKFLRSIEGDDDGED